MSPDYGSVTTYTIEVIRRSEFYAEISRHELIYRIEGHNIGFQGTNIPVEVATILRSHIDAGDREGRLKLQVEGEDERFRERSVYDWKVTDTITDKKTSAFDETEILEVKT